MVSSSSSSSSSSNSGAFQSTQGISAYFVLFSALLAFVLVLSKLLHDRPGLNNVFPEAGMIILVGAVAGFFVNLFVATTNGGDDDAYDESVAQSLLSFSTEVFFVALLPPIIFNSGYHLRRELFFRHIVPIGLFAVFGTLASAVGISCMLEWVKELGLTGGFSPTFTELLAFGALISATDPVSTLAVFQAKRVDPQLFYLVFGESALNDAVGLVLFGAFSNFVVKDNEAEKVVIGVGEFMGGLLYDSIGSPLLGILSGCGAALLFKYIDMRNHRLLELSVYILIMYVPFLLAQVIQLSGIVTILFTGMAARAFVVPNLSEVTADNAETLFRLFAHLSETSIFLELGLSVFGLSGSLNARFILWALLACLVGRVLNVYPITVLYNLRLRTEPKSDAEHAADRRSQRKCHFEIANSNDAHVEMIGLPSPGHLEQGNWTPGLAVTRQDSNTTTPSMAPRVRRDLEICPKTAHMLCFSGLRGAVAYACVRSFPDTFGHRTEFVSTTMMIILVTVFAMGCTTSAMLEWLEIDMNVDEDIYMESWHQERRSAGILLVIEELIQRNIVREHHTSPPMNAPNHHSSRSQMTTVSAESTASLDYYCNVEMTEERHIATVESLSSPTPRRRSSSLFDFGFKD